MFGKDKKGFRKPKKKEIKKIQEKAMAEANKLAHAFLDEFEELTKKHKITIIGTIKEVGPGIYQAGTKLEQIKEKKEANTKPWADALADNLKARKGCTHKEDQEGLGCDTCGLPKDKWREGGKGITDEYEAEALKRIEKAIEDDAECKKGNHKPNDEAGEKGAMSFCVHCRKPKDEWKKEEEVKEEAE